jgi:hypothetical protein
MIRLYFFCWPGSTHLTRDPVTRPSQWPGRVSKLCIQDNYKCTLGSKKFRVQHESVSGWRPRHSCGTYNTTRWLKLPPTISLDAPPCPLPCRGARVSLRWSDGCRWSFDFFPILFSLLTCNVHHCLLYFLLFNSSPHYFNFISFFFYLYKFFFSFQFNHSITISHMYLFLFNFNPYSFNSYSFYISFFSI